jgi:hypothetical protein
MRALTASELLPLWEQGGGCPVPQRALLLLRAACPETPGDTLERLPVGRRDDLLLQLRAAAFGPVLAATALCPQCGERLEMTLATDELRQPPAAATRDELTFDFAGHRLTCRLPDSLDLLEIAALPGPVAAESELLRRCVVSARAGDREVAPEALPATVVEALGQRLAEADPLADLQLALNCPACGHRWAESFDIVGFFWREIEAWATRLLHEVHTLATAYGWSEREIILLSPMRRRLYLEMVAA